MLLGNVANGAGATLGSVVVSARADGRMQVSAAMPDGKTYLFIWDGCAHGSSETYTIENGVAVLFLRESC